MTLEQSILDAIRTLPAERQAELMAFLEGLQARQRKPQRDSGYGLLAHLNFRISAEEIDDARREMWNGFPRDDI